MKTFGLQATLAMQIRNIRRNVVFLVKFCVLISVIVIVYSFLFTLIMSVEGQNYSFLTGLYWTLTTMSTLGYGDITFQTDLGRLFSVLVLLSGLVFMLVLLPFIIIQFVYAPIMAAQEASRAPKMLPYDEKGHVIIVSHDAVSMALIARLQRHHIPHVLLFSDVTEALSYADMGLRVMVGDMAHPETYVRAQVLQAALVVTTTEDDPFNTNVVFTARQLAETVPVVATARSADSVDILELAGATQVLLMSELMGTAMARHAGSGRSEGHVLGELGGILLVEANAKGTPWVGQTLLQADLGRKLGINIGGIWERGTFVQAGPQSLITENSVLFMGLSRKQLDRYNQAVGSRKIDMGLVLIIGGGLVGQATARVLEQRQINYRIVDRIQDGDAHTPKRKGGERRDRWILGDAADLAVLRNAGLDEAHAVIITTHSDDINIFLTIYCRRLKPGVKIISRASAEHNVATLHRAGADFVLSNATIGADAIFNHLQRGSVLTMVDGLFAERIPIPEAFKGRTLLDTQLRTRAGCSVLAVERDGKLVVNPPPDMALPNDGFLTMIFTPETEKRFLDLLNP